MDEVKEVVEEKPKVEIESNIIDGNIGSEAAYGVSFKNKQMIFKAKYEGRGGGAEFTGNIRAEYVLDAIAEAIPGELDDIVIEKIKQAMTLLG